MSALGRTITILGVSIIFIYSIIQILTFYGVAASTYGVYLFFYISMVLCVLVLPNSEPTL